VADSEGKFFGKKAGIWGDNGCADNMGAVGEDFDKAGTYTCDFAEWQVF